MPEALRVPGGAFQLRAGETGWRDRGYSIVIGDVPESGNEVVRDARIGCVLLTLPVAFDGLALYAAYLLLTSLGWRL